MKTCTTKFCEDLSKTLIKLQLLFINRNSPKTSINNTFVKASDNNDLNIYNKPLILQTLQQTWLNCCPSKSFSGREANFNVVLPIFWAYY